MYTMLYECPDIGSLVGLNLAFSDDGIHWTKHGPAPIIDWNVAYSSDSLFLNGKYHIWYSKRETAVPPYGWQIKYIQSSDMINYDYDTLTTVMVEDQDWESRVLSPTVLLRDGLFHMWYMADPDIAYATSPDGLVWTKHGPVLSHYGAQGVIYDKGIYKMFASRDPYRTIDLLESPDGIHWTNRGEVLAGTPGTWDNQGVTSPDILIIGGIYYMWYGGGVAYWPGNWKIGLATSLDGINWVKHPENPLLVPELPKVSCGVPDVVYRPAVSSLPSKVDGLAAENITNSSFKLLWNENPIMEEVTSHRVYLTKV